MLGKTICKTVTYRAELVVSLAISRPPNHSRPQMAGWFWPLVTMTNSSECAALCEDRISLPIRDSKAMKLESSTDQLFPTQLLRTSKSILANIGLKHFKSIK